MKKTNGRRPALAMGRVSLVLGGILAMSVQCGVSVTDEPLYRFDDCEELETYLHDQILHPRVETAAPGGAVGVFGCGGLPGGFPGAERPVARDGAAAPPPGGEQVSNVNAGESADAAAPPPADPAPGNFFGGVGEGEGEDERSGTSGNTTGPVRPDDDEEREFTETNTQEEEVDEADFVKNDGSFLYILRRGQMIIADAWPATDVRVISRTPLRGRGFTMFFDGDRALVASRTPESINPNATGGGLLFELYDLYDRANPRLLREVQVDGEWVDARRVGDEMLLVTRADFGWPQDWELGLAQGAFRDDENREILERRALLADAMPGLRDLHVGSDTVTREGDAFSCRQTWAPDASDGRSLVIVHTMSLGNERAPLKSTAVVADPDHIYASEKSIYLADTYWSDGGQYTPHLAETRFHKLSAFDDDGAADYVATGKVRGQLHNQFAIDEEGDMLRVVVTTNDDIERAPEAMTTSLLVLEHSEMSLREVGRVDDIGAGEFVQAVRFLGDRAYIVTFPIEGVDLAAPPTGLVIPPRPPGTDYPVDPLFVVDLSEPRTPKLRGELEVEGYSTYIHPLDRDHILTIGVETDDNGQADAMQLQIFDVTDLDAPQLAHKTVFGEGLGFSEALTNHHAFTFFPSQKALGVPLQLNNGAGAVTSTGLAVFRVDAEEGIEQLGVVEQLDMYGNRDLSWAAGQCATVRRSVMMADSDEAYVYAISTAGITVAQIADGVPEVATLELWEGGDATCAGDVPL
jgi:hypothetical protein